MRTKAFLPTPSVLHLNFCVHDSLPRYRSFPHANAFCTATSEGLFTWQHQGANARRNVCTVYKKIYLPLLLYPLVAASQCSLQRSACPLCAASKRSIHTTWPWRILRSFHRVPSAIEEEDVKRRNSCEGCIITVPRPPAGVGVLTAAVDQTMKKKHHLIACYF